MINSSKKKTVPKKKPALNKKTVKKVTPKKTKSKKIKPINVRKTTQKAPKKSPANIVKPKKIVHPSKTKVTPKKNQSKPKSTVNELKKIPVVPLQEEENPLEKKRILMIDDEEMVSQTIKRILTLNGYQSESALNGEEAKKQILGGFFNMALLDLKLPDINGIDLLKWIKRESPRTLIIVVTGYPSLDNAVEAINIGANAYIMKPINPKELLNFIEEKLRDQDNREMGVFDEILPNYLETIQDGNLWSVESISYKLKAPKLMVERISSFCANLGMVKYWRNKGVVQRINVKAIANPPE